MTPTPSPPAEAEAVIERLIRAGHILKHAEMGADIMTALGFSEAEQTVHDAIAAIRTLTTAREQAVAQRQELFEALAATRNNEKEANAAREQAERERDEAHNARIREVTEATRQRDGAVRDHAWAEQRCEILNRKYNQWLERYKAELAARQAAEARATALEEALRNVVLCNCASGVTQRPAGGGKRPDLDRLDAAMVAAQMLVGRAIWTAADGWFLAPQEPK